MRVCKLYMILVVMLLVAGSGYGQTSNPFEIQQRIKALPGQQDSAKEEISKNPFDVNREGAIPREEHDLNAPEILKSGWEVGGFMFWVFAGLIFYLALIMPFSGSTIRDYFRGLSGVGPFNILIRNHGSALRPSGIALYIFYVMNLGLFAYLAARQWDWLPQAQLSSLLFFVGIVAALSIAKLMAVNFLGKVFQLKKDAKKYGFLLAVSSAFTGIMLFPFNLFLAYGHEAVRPIALWAGVAVLAFLYIYKYMIGFSTASQEILRNKFNFFMYLCTLEIAPVLVLAKFLLSL